MYLEKEKTLIARDGEGKLLPVELTLETMEDQPKIKATPLTKGELQEIVRNPDSEDKVLSEHMIEPAYTEQEYKDLKISFSGAIRTAILALSTDTEQKALHDATVKAVLDAESKKKDTSLSEN